MNAHPVNRFKARLGKEQQIGYFSTLAAPVVDELLGSTGFDWVLIDTEHSPVDMAGVVSHLQAVKGTPISAIVRPAWNDMVLIKRILDQGAQSLLIPYVETVGEARQAVSYMRFPPEGVRGVSGGSRAANYGQTPGYFGVAEKELCLLVQIESQGALGRIEEIAAVEGVDGVFIGPSDVAASMGHIGNAQHPEVQAAINEGFARLKAMGKPSGYLTTNEAEAQRRIAEGVDFVGVTTDATLMVRAATAIVQKMKVK